MWWKRAVLAMAFAGVAGEMSAQAAAPALPEYSDQQRWSRLGFVDAAWITTAISLGKARGMSAEEIGQWMGEYFSTGWVGGTDARWFVSGLRQNHLAHPQGRVEVTMFSDTLVVARFNTPQLGAFGGDRILYGVSLDEWKVITLRYHRVLADHVGVKLDARYDGDWLAISVRNGYQALRASAQLRWERSALIGRVMVIELIRIAKSRGMTAAQAGADAVKGWAPGWATYDTPWRLFRGMTLNSMIDNDYTCEVLEGGPTIVRGRCNRPWLATVREQSAASGVSVEEYEAYFLALEQGIAATLGLSWDATVDGNSRMITVRRR